MDAKKVFYGMCAALALTVGGAGYGMYWADGQLKVRATDISRLNVEADLLDTKIANAKGLRTKLVDLEEIDALTKEVLPGSKSQENIVGELIAIASNRGLKLEAINFTSTSSGKIKDPELSQSETVDGISGVYRLRIQTSFETNYSNTLQMLRDLENNKRRFEVTNISISPNAVEGESSDNFNVSIDIATYIKP